MNERGRTWRVIGWVLLLAAILGPWAFDRINVPAEYPCDAPFVRLKGDFCGLPLSGLWMLWAFAAEFTRRVVGVITGELLLADLALVSGIFLAAFLLVLPLTSILLLIRAGNLRRGQIFNAAACALAAGISLMVGATNYPERFWVLWGIWLYAVVAAGMVILELRLLGAGSSLREGR